MTRFKPGGDQQAIHHIARENYGDLKGLFSQHNWEWQGSRSMAAVATLIKEEYGSIKDFEVAHYVKNDVFHGQVYGSLESNIGAGNVWLVGYEVGLKTTWEPEHWGVDGFTKRKDAEEFLGQSRNGALFVCYDATEGSKNRVLGIYQYDTTEYVSFEHHMSQEALSSLGSGEKASWKSAFRAVKCWTAPISSNLNAETLFPEAYLSSQSLDAAKIEGSKRLDQLSAIEWADTPFFKGQNADDPFQGNPDVWITSFWGWSPETWGCVGFTSKARPHNIIKKTTDPFIMVIYVTETAPGDSTLKGKVAGYYELSHEIGLKEDFISADQLNAAHHPKEKWAHSFRAIRAWEIDDKFKPTIREFHPDLVKNKQQQTVSTWAKELPIEQIERLKALPRKQIKVFKGPKVLNDTPVIPSGSGRVGGGNFRGGGYEVGEPQSTEKQLYILELSGVASDFVENANQDQKIFKVGLSAWPPGRKLALNTALPNGKFSWGVRNMTENEDLTPYANFNVAKIGEDAMKDFLAEKHRDSDDATRHLGGEFYLTDESSINSAWKLGCDAANEAESKNNG